MCSLVLVKRTPLAPSFFALMAVKSPDVASPCRCLGTRDLQWEESRPGCTAYSHPCTTLLTQTSFRYVVLVVAWVLNLLMAELVHEMLAAFVKVKCTSKQGSLFVGYETMCAAKQQVRVKKSRWTLKVFGNCYRCYVVADVLGVSQSRTPILLCASLAHRLLLIRQEMLDCGCRAAMQLICRAVRRASRRGTGESSLQG